MTCRVDGCDTPVGKDNKRGYCRVHSGAAGPLERAKERGDREVVIKYNHPLGSSSPSLGQGISLPRAPWSREVGE